MPASSSPASDGQAKGELRLRVGCCLRTYRRTLSEDKRSEHRDDEPAHQSDDPRVVYPVSGFAYRCCVQEAACYILSRQMDIVGGITVARADEHDAAVAIAPLNGFPTLLLDPPQLVIGRTFTYTYLNGSDLARPVNTTVDEQILRSSEGFDELGAQSAFIEIGQQTAECL